MLRCFSSTSAIDIPTHEYPCEPINGRSLRQIRRTNPGLCRQPVNNAETPPEKASTSSSPANALRTRTMAKPLGTWEPSVYATNSMLDLKKFQHLREGQPVKHVNTRYPGNASTDHNQDGRTNPWKRTHEPAPSRQSSRQTCVQNRPVIGESLAPPVSLPDSPASSHHRTQPIDTTQVVPVNPATHTRSKGEGDRKITLRIPDPDRSQRSYRPVEPTPSRSPGHPSTLSDPSNAWQKNPRTFHPRTRI